MAIGPDIKEVVPRVGDVEINGDFIAPGRITTADLNRQVKYMAILSTAIWGFKFGDGAAVWLIIDTNFDHINRCLLYTSDAADERSSVDLGGRRIIKKKKKIDKTSSKVMLKTTKHGEKKRTKA